MEDLIKIKPDKERARGLLKLARLRIERVRTFDETKESALLVEGYYEAAKELITAILFADGYKTLSHRALIDCLASKYAASFPEADVALLDRLRKMRNDIAYNGIFIDPSFLARNRKYADAILSRLFGMVEEKVKEKVK